MRSIRVGPGDASRSPSPWMVTLPRSAGPIRLCGMALCRAVQDWPVAARSDRHIATAMSAAVAPVTMAKTPAMFA